MASFGSRPRPNLGRGHLDATASREVVFCHNPDCQHEWYRDEHSSLQCPECGGDFTEIIDPSHDPRQVSTPPPLDFSSFAFSPRPRGPASDSDPGEGDIEDHLQPGQRGSMPRRPVRPGAGLSDNNDTFLRFTEMLMSDLGAARLGRRPDLQSQFPPSPGGHDHHYDHDHDHDDFHFSALPRVQQRTVFRSSGPIHVGSASFTITTATGPASQDDPLNFGGLFNNLMNPLLGPNGGDANRQAGAAGAGAADAGAAGAGGGPAAGPLGPMNILHELLFSLINPESRVHGDAVYSQEALDRIITGLMEANPLSNAAPPASQSAIDKLETKHVDIEMLGPEGKAECTICMDELNIGEAVLSLPCKHWFHGECVKLWLKQHNTCPICRAPIGDNDERQRSNARQQPHQQQQPQNAETSAAASLNSPFDPAGPFGAASSFSSAPPRAVRQTQILEDRLNTLRNLADVRQRGPSSGPPPGPRPQSLSRRNSLSPSTPRTYSISEHASLTRVRSPVAETSSDNRDSWVSGRFGSSSSRRRQGSQDRDSRESRDSRDSRDGQSSGHGPLSWLRNLGRGSGHNSERDRRR